MSDANSSLTVRVGVAGVAAAMSEIQKLASGLAGAFSFITAEFNPAAVLDSVKGVLQFGSDLQRLHDKTGIAVSDLVAIDKAFSRIGESADSAAVLISKMQKTVANAALGKDQAAIQDFSVLGLDPQKLSQLNASEQFLQIGKAIDAVTNADQRAAIATDIFSKSGANLLAAFRNGSLMSDLANGAGKFGEVMQRNAKGFQDAVFDLKQASTGPQKFWAGFLDLIPVKEISDRIYGAFEDLDIVGIGQKFGALTTIIVNSFRDDKFPEMLGLLIEAGFDLGIEAIKVTWSALWVSLTGATAGQIYLALINAIITFGVKATQVLVEALYYPVVVMAAAFDWAWGKIKIGFTVVSNFMSDALAAVLNHFIDAWNVTLGKLTGQKFKPMIAPHDAVPKDSSFSESWQAAQEAGAESGAGIVDYLQQQLEKTRQLLGLNGQLGTGDNKQITALQKLLALIDEEIRKRNSVKTANAQDNGQVVQGFDVRRALASEEIIMKRGLLAIDQKIAQVEGDYTKTTVQKYAEEKTLLQEKIAGLELVIALNEKLIQSPGTSETDRQLLQQRNQGYSTQLVGAQDKFSKMGPDPESYTQQFAQAFTQIQDQWGTWATQMASTFKSVFDSAISSISSGITGLIMGTKTWGQALMQIGTSILTSIVQAIVQMGVRWVLTQIMMAVAGKAILASATAATAPIAAAQAAIWAVPATLSAIASYGASAAAAPGFIGMAEAIVSAQSALGSFDTGGYTGAGGRYEPAGVVHRGEIVWTQNDVARAGGVSTVEAMRTGAGPSVSSGNQTELHVHTWADENAMLKFIRNNDDVKHVIIDTVNKHVRTA